MTKKKLDRRKVLTQMGSGIVTAGLVGQGVTGKQEVNNICPPTISTATNNEEPELVESARNSKEFKQIKKNCEKK